MAAFKNKERFFTLLRRLPLVIMGGSALLLALFGRDLSAERLISYSPESPLLAALCLIGLYAVKSLSVFFPILALYLCAGFLFPPLTAMLVNILGVAVCLTVPYLIGFYSGHELSDRLLRKYPKATLIDSFKRNNPFFLPFFTRILGFLPGDVVSLLLGARRVNFFHYLFGSLAGMLPGIVCVTLLGDSIADPSSWQFFASLGVTAVFTGGSLLLYWKVLRPKGQKGAR